MDDEYYMKVSDAMLFLLALTLTATILYMIFTDSKNHTNNTRPMVLPTGNTGGLVAVAENIVVQGLKVSPTNHK